MRICRVTTARVSPDWRQRLKIAAATMLDHGRIEGDTRRSACSALRTASGMAGRRAGTSGIPCRDKGKRSVHPQAAGGPWCCRPAFYVEAHCLSWGRPAMAMTSASLTGGAPPVGRPRITCTHRIDDFARTGACTHLGYEKAGTGRWRRVRRRLREAEAGAQCLGKSWPPACAGSGRAKWIDSA